MYEPFKKSFVYAIHTELVFKDRPRLSDGRQEEIQLRSLFAYFGDRTAHI